MVRQELQFESNGKEKFALLILTLITRHRRQPGEWQGSMQIYFIAQTPLDSAKYHTIDSTVQTSNRSKYRTKSPFWC